MSSCLVVVFCPFLVNVTRQCGHALIIVEAMRRCRAICKTTFRYSGGHAQVPPIITVNPGQFQPRHFHRDCYEIIWSLVMCIAVAENEL